MSMVTCIYPSPVDYTSAEELLIVLEGEGQMIFSDGSTLPVKSNTALYCPPRTEHDVKNTGTVPLRYIYVAAEVR